MYAIKQKKEYAPGTFIPTPARIAAIIQLCLAFTVILWTIGYPFMGKHFELKSKIVVYEHVVTSPYFDNSDRIVKEYDALKHEIELPFWDKMGVSLKMFLYDVPLLEKMWMLLAVVLPIMALRKREGAKQAVWILPLVVLAYAINNQMYGLNSGISEETKLFPTEEVIVQNYLNEPLKESIMDQQKQLQKGWEIYLVQEWAKEVPALSPEDFEKQVKKGDFAFSVARLDKISRDAMKQHNPFNQKQPIALLFLYFVWNILFAWLVWKPRTTMQVSVAAHQS